MIAALLMAMLARSLDAGEVRPSAAELARRVVILANSADAESILVARHYATRRAVPPENVIALPMPSAETISWAEFVVAIWQPLMARLVRDGWMDAVTLDLTDRAGRRKMVFNSHRIAAVVVCRGVPLRIAHDAALYEEAPPFTQRTEFRTNAGAVDAEIALLAMPNHPINAFVLNPVFAVEHPSEYQTREIVKVSRLDGPSVADALSLVDQAVQAEAEGLAGRAYVDLSNRDEIGNRWLRSTAEQLRELGFDTDVHSDPALLPLDGRIDRPALYFGWYASDLGGALALPGFRFPAGAVAVHIHSFSATTVRSSTAGWAGPLVARGVTATVGNVYEPYLQLTHRPNLMLRALARGETLVDSAYFALQALSWQQVLIGDPLYRPFARSLEDQLARLGELPAAAAGHVVLRRVLQLEQLGRTADALALLRDAHGRHPTLATGVALAQRLLAAGETAAAGSALGFLCLADSFGSEEWAVARDAARLLAEAGRLRQSVAVWRTLLADPALPKAVRVRWASEAAEAARAAGEPAPADRWEIGPLDGQPGHFAD